MSRENRPAPPLGRDVLIAVNPTAGSTETAKFADVLKCTLVERGYAASTESDVNRIRRWVESIGDGIRCVVAAGGDGTIAMLANHLPASTPFAILPQGTENLLAKYLEIPYSPEKVADVIEGGLLARLDAGEANQQLFLVMASSGFDAQVVHQVHRARKGNIRHWAYAKPIIDSIRKYRYPTLSIWCDDDPDPIRVKWAFVFNAPRYAMGLPIADEADAMDGMLDLCSFRGGNLINGLMYLAGIVTRRHRSWQDTTIRKARRIRMESDEPVPFQIDGDPGGHLPLEIRVIPQRLSILVPQTWADRFLTKPARLQPETEKPKKQPI